MKHENINLVTLTDELGDELIKAKRRGEMSRAVLLWWIGAIDEREGDAFV